MAHLVCPRCQRANPGDAVFCWFDGSVLRHAAGLGATSPSQLPQEFVFPSGRRCRTYDELVEGCQAEWEDSRDMLRKGEFGLYLARLGRMDLVRAAKDAQAQADPDIAMQNFLSSLPASPAPGRGPRLDLNPRRLMLGAMRVGEQRQVRVTVSNRGNGLLQGKVRVTEGEQWLKIVPLTPTPLPSGERGGGEGNERELQLKTARDQEVTLRVEPRGLPAGQTYSAKLTVVTNGGVAEAPVRLDLTAAPFGKPPFQGASSAREMAERMRANPKQAGPMLESGDVARWFAVNGWSYPVAGTPARGVAAVQQFFECMGLSKPPPLHLSQNEFRCQCNAPETVRGQVTIRTPARKWVYAQAAGDQPWLRVTTPNVSGPQQTTISFEADSALMGNGPIQDGILQITANAGQRFQVRVHVEVRRPRGYQAPAPPPPRPAPRSAFAPPLEPAPVTLTPRQVGLKSAPPTMQPGPVFLEALPQAPPRPASSYAGRLVQAVLVGAALALLLRTALLLPADLYARVLVRAATGGTAAQGPTVGGWDFWRLGPMTEAAGDKPSVIDPGSLRQFVFATWWVGVVAGLVLVRRAGGRAPDMICGLVAGAAAGVVAAATLGCLLVLCDGLPRLLLQMLGGVVGSAAASASPWLVTPLWMLLAVGGWTFLGAVAGFSLGLLGPYGGRVLTAAAAPLAWMLRICGLGGVASFFILS